MRYITPEQRVRLAAVAFIASALAACAATDVAPLHESATLHDDEASMWAESDAMATTIRERLASDDLAAQRYCQAVLDRVVAATASLPSDKLPTITVLASPAANAFALPNGDLFITNGMLALIENESQLAFILAHELAHYLNRHSLTTTRHAANMRARWTFGALLVAGLGSNPMPASQQQMWERVSTSGYSRELEGEADELGLRMSVRAGYSGQDGATTLAKLRSPDNKLGDMLFASHPSISQRIDAMTALMETSPELVGTAGPDPDLEYQRMFDQLIVPQAQALVANGELYAANDVLTRYLTRFPQDGAALFTMGEAIRVTSSSRENSARAAEFYERAVAATGAPAAAYKELGMHFRLVDDHERASEYFREYLARSPDVIDAALIARYIDD